MNIFGGRKNLKNGRGGPLEIGDDVFFVPYGGKRIFSEGRDDGICFILKSLEEQCVPKIYIRVDFISIPSSKRMKLKWLLKSATQMGTSSSINSCALKAK